MERRRSEGSLTRDRDAGTPSRAALTGLVLVSSTLRALGPFRRDLAWLIGVIWYSTRPQEQRSRTAEHHRRLNPSLSPAAAQRLARRSHVEYTLMVLDSAAAEAMTAREVRRRIVVHNEERLRAEGGAVLALPHFGNWDISASAALAIGLPVTTVMAPVASAFVTKLVAWSRRRKGLELFTPERAARGLLRSLRAGRMVALMADVPEAGPTVTVEYCGGTVLFSAAPARLAQVTGRPLLPMACWRAGAGWVVHVGARVPVGRGDSDQDVMKRVAAALEPLVRRHPEQWYPFHAVYVDGSSV